jgi:hypothetical protein
MRVIICENDGAMDSLLKPPAATTFDAVSAVLSALVYLLVAIAALVRRPDDARVRVFLGVALASAAPYCVTALIWYGGASAAWSKGVVILVAFSLMIGSLLLLHFTQVFPWRRPWIRRHGMWLWAGYAVVLLIALGAAMLVPAFSTATEEMASGGVGAVSDGMTELLAIAALLVFIPALLVLGIVVPLAGLLSLYKSWLAARVIGAHPARVTTFWMLVSQMGGGVLTILIIPMLRLVAPTGPWVTIAAALLFGFSLLMPLAFGLGVFRLGVLEAVTDLPPQ